MKWSIFTGGVCTAYKFIDEFPVIFGEWHYQSIFSNVHKPVKTLLEGVNCVWIFLIGFQYSKTTKNDEYSFVKKFL